METITQNDRRHKGAGTSDEAGARVRSGEPARERLARLLDVPGATHERVAELADLARPYVTMQLTGTRPVIPEVLVAAEIVAREAVGRGLADLGVRLGGGLPFTPGRLAGTPAVAELITALRTAAEGLTFAADMWGASLRKHELQDVRIIAAGLEVYAGMLEQ